MSNQPKEYAFAEPGWPTTPADLPTSALSPTQLGSDTGRAARPAAPFTRTPVEIRATGVVTFAVSVPCRRTSWAGMLHTPDLEIQVHRALQHVRDCDRCRAGGQSS